MLKSGLFGLFGALLLVLAPLRAAEVPPAPQVVPSLSGRSLTGRKAGTDALRGKVHLLVVGFDRGQGKDMREWAAEFRKAFSDESRADYFEIAALPSQYRLFRVFIEKGMVKGTPEAARSRIVTIFGADTVCKKLGITDRKQVHAFLLDREGRIVARGAGEYSADRFSPLKEAAEKLLAPGASS